MSNKLKSQLILEAAKLGFDAVGVMTADQAQDHKAALTSFVASGFHGSMAWLEDTLERRSHPKNLWPGVRSIIVLATNYGPESDPLAALEKRDQGTISVYARHRDYHDVIKGRLKTLTSKLVAQSQQNKDEIEAKVFVDTAPVMEKPLAQAAGLGWQGKHTNLVSKQFGSWLFLGSIFTNLELEADVGEVDHCGSCTSCLSACPTNAFPAPYQLDARRCISYLTIENKGPIPLEFRKAMGNRIYGCDDCLAVCPWNKFAKTTNEIKLASPTETPDQSLAGFLGLDDAAFRARFSGSPVKRIGRNRFIRNCLVAAGNSGDTGLISHVNALTIDSDPIIRETAAWALQELQRDNT